MASSDLGWDDLPNEPYYPDPTRLQIAVFMQKRNPRRWAKLTKEFKWLQDEMRKIGLNPDDARFLL